MAKLDVNKPLEEMNEQEKMIYYFLNCHKGIEDSKIKVMIESDGVIQMLEKRVETISDDGWKKIIEDFRKLHENEERMERQLELEEAHKAKEEAKKVLQEAKKDVPKAKISAIVGNENRRSTRFGKRRYHYDDRSQCDGRCLPHPCCKNAEGYEGARRRGHY